MTQNPRGVNNQLLAALPEVEYQRIAPYLELTDLPLGYILDEPKGKIESVYFPNSSMISLVSILSDNATTEIGLIGKEGMVGLPIILGGNHSAHLGIVQVAGTAMKLNAEVLIQEFQQKESLYKLLLLYTEVRLNQIAQIAVCKSHHDIQKRFCRWLLSVQDCVEQDELFLTQIFISQMLGVRRASVTKAAQVLQNQGLINYQRGRVTILNRQGLEAHVCECYHWIKNDYHRLLGNV
ncbi:Crp/Fnr family transcriptional regulator [Crocosphaera sp. XPORK-15E]|uniref:Crp/Fnr family transcriptional regulator n=1 Tax=Crocosphaera sp. XPORK-15E TaxID=3110247 RepID=UPI002B1F6C54|nr:Crp/Fnr family transcriptional regulator [Crocosphaera sp. XPORK-15E]MEA5536483.1 Crp/Fnr family transcriptional regulator [Crocosphaera sp. XPORK-15E]